MAGQDTSDLAIDLSAEEREILDDFLASPLLDERAMDLSTLEGFLTVLVIGPRILMPSQWMPWVWDRIDGRNEPAFEDLDEANRMLGLIMRLYNAVVQRFMRDAADFRPICLQGGEWGVSEWCEGFLLGTRLDPEPWSLLMVGQPAWLTPFMRLGTDDGLRLTEQDGDAERWVSEIVPSLTRIHAFWLERRKGRTDDPSASVLPLAPGPREPIVRDGPKVGRNDPCPCGSGKKFKKCCGGPSPLH